MSRPIPIEELKQAARKYATGRDASGSLGISEVTFSRLCRKYGIETPFERNRRLDRQIAKELGEFAKQLRRAVVRIEAAPGRS